jgi:diguanylate cyclase (GGDEF)-like protein/PAS domain S-box-containing protein
MVRPKDDRASDAPLIPSVPERGSDASLLSHLGSIYEVLSATNEAVLRARDAESLYQQVCDAATHSGTLNLAAVCVLCPSEGGIRVVASAGSANFAEFGALQISVEADSPFGRGLVGTAFREGRTTISNDLLADPRLEAWRQRPDSGRRRVEHNGMRSGAAVPIAPHGLASGIFLVYSARLHAFDDRTVQLIERMARNISFALELFSAEADRRAAEETLRISERRYRGILESIEDAYYEVDLGGRHMFFNQAFPRLIGYTTEELAGTRHRDFQTPEMARQVVGVFAEVFETGNTRTDAEWSYLHKDGSVVRVEGSVHLLYDSNADRAGFYGVMRDITARRRTELALRHSEERYRSIVESIGDPYYEVDLQGVLTLVNPAFCRMLGYAPPDILGCSYRQFQTREMSTRVFEIFNAAFRTRETVNGFDWEMIRSDGSVVMGEGSVQPIGDAAAHITGFRGILRDVTERRRMEEAVRESEARFRALTELSSDWYWELDSDCRYVALEGHRGVGGPLTRSFIGKRAWETALQVEAPGGWDLFRRTLELRQSFRDVVMVRLSRSHDPFYISASGEPVFNSAGTFTGYRGASREITEQKLAETRVQYLANHDPLTGLANRTSFSQLLGVAIETARRYDRGFALLYIDLDRFKFVNDTLGHQTGDELLITLSVRFRAALRTSDVLARLGGDEFVVMVQEVDSAVQAAAVARKLLEAASTSVTFVSGRDCRISASIGVAQFPLHGKDEAELMKSADIAMYFAKERGKNNFQFYSSDIDARANDRLMLESHLRDALQRGEFTLHYQPKLRLENNRINGSEALLRWHNPILGNVPPGRFIALAEETGLIVPIGRWVLREACRQNMAWRAEGIPELCVAVNLSARQFDDDGLLDDIADALKASGMPARLLELEITEGMVIADPNRAIAMLHSIKSMGVRLAIDDFGTGYSSLAQLKRYPIDTLKVDQAFLRDIPANEQDKAITLAIISMARTLGLTVVAEGVETAEQLQFLREAACDELQGYFFSRPVDATAFGHFVREHVDAASLQLLPVDKALKS